MSDLSTGSAKRCWARSLGNCEGKISREHLVSECFFPVGGVKVKGQSWCLDEEKEVGLASLTGKIRCQKHNSDLSELDTAIATITETLSESVKLFESRKRVSSRRWRIERYTIDGLLLERWFLKTFINLSVVDNKWIIGEGTHPCGMPSDDLVRIAFGLNRFEGNLGLSIASHVGEQFI